MAALNVSSRTRKILNVCGIQNNEKYCTVKDKQNENKSNVANRSNISEKSVIREIPVVTTNESVNVNSEDQTKSVNSKEDQHSAELLITAVKDDQGNNMKPEEMEALESEVVYTVQSIDDLAKGNYTPVEINDSAQYDRFENEIINGTEQLFGDINAVGADITINNEENLFDKDEFNALLNHDYAIIDIETDEVQNIVENVNMEEQNNEGINESSELYLDGDPNSSEINQNNGDVISNGNGRENEDKDDNNGNEENDESPDFNPNDNSNDSDESTASHENKRKRHKKRTPECWEKNKIKLARMKGVSYLGYSRKKNIELEKYDVEKGIKRKERQMGPVCTSKVCKVSKIRKCTSFTEDKRQQLFKKFWELSWEEKAMMVSGLVSMSKPKQKKVKTDGSKSRRSTTFTYHLKLENDRVPVCKKFFLSALGLNEWMVQNWTKKHSEDFDTLDEEANSSTEEGVDKPTTSTVNKTGKPLKGNRPVDERMDCLRRFFEDLPKVPSHYCRRSTSKQYLETNLESKINLYRLYVEEMKTKGKTYYSTFVFDSVFDDLKLSIFQPRKDRCDICYAYESKNLDTGIWENHITDKDRSRLEKEMDKEKAVAKQIHCLTMDLQAVKCVPNITASESYYKTKLACHNFTVYNLANHHCCNYWWNESEGDLSASVFASLITDYLERHCLEPKVPIVIFSDGCGYQNRNATLANAIQKFSKDNIVEEISLKRSHSNGVR